MILFLLVVLFVFGCYGTAAIVLFLVSTDPVLVFTDPKIPSKIDAYWESKKETPYDHA